MRIALLGQAAFAVKALEALIVHSDEIVHVFAPPDSAAGKPDPLAAKPCELGLPLSQPKSFKDDAAYEHFRTLGADLAILAFVTLIVPERILYTPRYKSIYLHPSLLPRHRGASGINWAIIQGDAETGVTWFWPDAGIDTGLILVQKRVPIAEHDTVGSIYFNTLFAMGIDAMIEAVDLIKAGKAPATIQDESKATYEPPCRDEHARIDFAKPAREVFNLIRGCDPQPGAFATLGEKRIRLYEAAFSRDDGSGEVGRIVAIDSAGMKIALAGGTIIVKRARIDPNPKPRPRNSSRHPSLNKTLVLELARSEYVARRENVIAVGNSGTGKTHVALGLGLAACQKGLAVGFTTAAALVNELHEVHDEKRLLRLQRQLAGYKLLIIDELGYVPLWQTGAELLFEVACSPISRQL